MGGGGGGGGTEKMADTTIPLGLLGLPLFGDDSRNTQLLHLVVKEVLCPSKLCSN